MSDDGLAMCMYDISKRLSGIVNPTLILIITNKPSETAPLFHFRFLLSCKTQMAQTAATKNKAALKLLLGNNGDFEQIAAKLAPEELMLLVRHLGKKMRESQIIFTEDGVAEIELDPVVNPKSERLSFEPIQYPALYVYYLDAVGAYWAASEVDLTKDMAHWEHKLKPDERHFIEMVLAFFAVADGLVMKNLALNMLQTITIPEAFHYYAFQVAVESVHSEMYSKLIVAYVKDPVRRAILLNSINDVPVIKRKGAWVQKWIDADVPISKRLAAFAVVEGVFFSSSFCAIFWLKKRGLMPGLTHSNELISRDEGSHMEFAVMMYHYSRIGKFTQSEIEEMVAEAIDIEDDFVRGALPVRLLGMNADTMMDYVKYCADRLLWMLGFKRMFHTSNPFDFMTMISIDEKTNFFEAKVGQYQKAGVSANVEDMLFSLDADV